MTNVSKQKLPDAKLHQLFTQLTTITTSISTQQSALFFSELLGPEEKIMLTKRLASVVMFIEGNSSYRVHQLLKISPSTAESIRRDYETGRYKNLEQIVTKNTVSYKKFWETLEVILQAGMPPMGRGRWKSVFQAK